jgi:AcrR family transcriptional regulator
LGAQGWCGPGIDLQNRTIVRFILAAVSTLPVPAKKAAASLRVAKPARVARSLQKGQQTRAAILEAALGLASHMGLEGLSIGALADVTGMSKSGVFAHFGSREELQIAVVTEYHAKFEEEVFFTAIREPRGLPRLRAMFERWVRRVSVEVDSGCIYISGAVEFDDRPGPVRDALVAMVKAWHAALQKAITLSIGEGHLKADADVEQICFELHGLILSLHHDARFMRIPGALARAGTGFDRTIQFYATPLGLQVDQARKSSKNGAAARR